MIAAAEIAPGKANSLIKDQHGEATGVGSRRQAR
jgi:hypothetical protein